PGITQYVIGIDHRRHQAGLASHKIEDLSLLHKTDVFDRGLPVLLNIRSDHLARVANEEAIGHLTQPIARDFREEMMRHLLLIKNAAAIWNRSGQVRDDFPPVSLAYCNHFLRTRVVSAGFLQIKSIEWLI